MKLGILATFSCSFTHCVPCFTVPPWTTGWALLLIWIATSVTRQHAGQLPEYPRFGFFRIPLGHSQSLSPECLSVTNKTVAGAYQNKLRLSWLTEMLIILIKARKCLYSWHGLCQQFGQIWKETAEKIHAEETGRTIFCSPYESLLMSWEKLAIFAERHCVGWSPLVAGSQLTFRGADVVYGD
jgi:hypothetical protein